MEDAVDLGSIELSLRGSDLSLSAKAFLFAPDLDMTKFDPSDIVSLVRDNQLWFVPPTVCQIQFVVGFGGYPVTSDHRPSKPLEHIAAVLCQSMLWPSLGLAVSVADINYELESNDSPNISIKIEHPDKSFALVSPPHIKTSCVEGMMLYLNIKANPPHSSAELAISRSESSVERRRQIAHLILVALHLIVEPPKRFDGIKVRDLRTAPSLLELAPAVLNVHYLERISCHSKVLPTISSALVAARSWQSESLRRKLSNLLGRSSSSQDTTEAATFAYQRVLWESLLSRLSVTTGTRAAREATDHEARRAILKDFEEHYLEDDGTPEDFDNDGSYDDDYDGFQAIDNDLTYDPDQVAPLENVSSYGQSQETADSHGFHDSSQTSLSTSHDCSTYNVEGPMMSYREASSLSAPYSNPFLCADAETGLPNDEVVLLAGYIDDDAELDPEYTLPWEEFEISPEQDRYLQAAGSSDSVDWEASASFHADDDHKDLSGNYPDLF